MQPIKYYIPPIIILLLLIKMGVDVCAQIPTECFAIIIIQSGAIIILMLLILLMYRY
jgi:hypothetical protein